LGEEIACTKETKLQQQKRKILSWRKNWLESHPSTSVHANKHTKGERRKKESSIVALG
jgi:hypothetical protein